MKIVIRLILISSLFGMFQKVAFGQAATSAVPFLLVAPDSRAGGIGESGAGLADNSAAIFWRKSFLI